MKRIALAVSLFTIVPLIARAQTNPPAATTQTREPWDWTKYKDKFEQKDDALTPNADDLTLAAGVAFVADTIKLPEAGAKVSGTQFGGYIAGDWFISSAVAFQAQLIVFSESDSATVNGTSFSSTTTIFVFDVAGKIYPLKLSEFNQWRLQPFVRLAIGAVFYDFSVSGASVDASPAIVGEAGGGLDFAITPHWSLTAEGNYFSTLSDSTITVQGSGSTTLRQDGLLATAGLRYRF